MANGYTAAPINTGDTTGGTSFASGVIKDAYDKYFELALRHQPILREIADKRPVQLDKPSGSITLSIHKDLAPVTGTLTDGTDVTPVTLAKPDTVTIDLEERGNAVVETKLLREFALTDVDPYVANTVAYNMRDSLDIQFQTVLRSGTNVMYGGDAGATNAVNNSDKISSDLIRKIVTKLRGNAAVPRRDDLYGAWLHPDVAYDLKSETGQAAWRDPHVYVAPDNLWRHVIGVYEGAYFIESARMYVAADGAGTVKAKNYRTIFAGQQAVAEAVAVEPQLVMSGSVGQDLLSRLYTIGWYSVLGWSVYRQAALMRLETGSTINGADEL